MRRAVMAGSFDPFTQGHLDILRRGTLLFDEVILACGVNPGKQTTFTIQERMELLRQCTAELAGVTVQTFQGLLIDYCREVPAGFVLRGLRAVTDFEFEFKIGLANMDMAPDLQTVFLLSRPDQQFISSSLIKEIHINGGDVSRYVPPPVLEALREKLA